MTHIRVVVKGLGPGRLVSGRESLQRVSFLREMGLENRVRRGGKPSRGFPGQLEFLSALLTY